MKWQLSFKTKIQFLLLGVSFIAIVLLGVEGYQSAQALHSGKVAVLKAAADGLMDKIDRNLFERYGDIQAFALSEPARSMNPQRIHDFMNDMMVTYAPIYDLMIVTDTSGKVIAVSSKDKTGKEIPSEPLIGADFSKTSWFKQAIADKIPAGASYVEDLHVDEDVASILGNEGRVMNFTAPIRSKENGKILGVWTNRMSWADVVEAITKEEMDKIRSGQIEASIAYITSRKGTYLLHPEGEEFELKRSHDVVKAKNKNMENTPHPIREIDVVTPHFTGRVMEYHAQSKGYSIYPGRGWSAIVQIPSEDAQKRVNNMIIIFAFTIIAIVNFFSFLVLRKLSGSFEGVVFRMTKESAQVKSAATQISMASQQLSSSTTEQAAAIEETAASMEEITGMLSQTTQNAAQCKKLSEEGQVQAEKGKNVISKMSSAMEDIELANKKLDRLVAVIDEIGDKTTIINDIVSETRLLSFNASIEAARAGVHGKGFAVVAEEVGKLASISGKAADEIKNLLDSSVKEVTDVVKETQERVHFGKDISHECELTFSHMGSALESVNDLVKTIAVASKEQELGIKQVTQAISEMDKVTQANSHNAESLSSEASGLHRGAESLNTSIDGIQLIVNGGAYEKQNHLPPRSSDHSEFKMQTPEFKSTLTTDKPAEEFPSRGDRRWKTSA